MRIWIVIGALNAFVAVALGAFAAHGLRGSVPEADLAIFQTGAHYHIVHALALVAVGLLAGHVASWRTTAAGVLFFAGSILFSGSLYYLGISGSRALVMVTPLGGLAFLLGWLMVALAALGLRPAGARRDQAAASSSSP
tara:strand:- start:2846 stop:3262 length:417 start_codon:yes stop_codon:yes gene_type:complete